MQQEEQPQLEEQQQQVSSIDGKLSDHKVRYNCNTNFIGSGTVVRSGNSTGSSPHPLNGLLTTILTTVNGNTVTLAAILEEQKRLSDSITELQQKSFSIEGSVYKVLCI